MLSPGRDGEHTVPDSKVHGANMGLTWVLPAPDGPHVGPMNLAIGGGGGYLRRHLSAYTVDMFYHIKHLFYLSIGPLSTHPFHPNFYAARYAVYCSPEKPSRGLISAPIHCCKPHNVESWNNGVVTRHITSRYNICNFLNTMWWSYIYLLSMMMAWHDNALYVTEPFWRISIGHRWIPVTNG